MTKAQTLAKQLRDESTRTDGIVHHDYSLSLERALRKSAKQMIWNGDVVEFWGGTDRNPWRVHLDLPKQTRR